MEFPETTWGTVQLLGPGGPARRREGLEKLCRRYWEPIRCYARAAWLAPGDDPSDLAQDFFVWLVEAEGDVLAKYAPERGRFRGFLKGVLRNFGRNRVRAARRRKRGGEATHVPLDEAAAPEARPEDPEAAFDRAWRDEVLRRAIDRVRAASKSALHERQWRAFEACDLAPEDRRPTYAELAGRLAVKESDVRNYLFAVRERVRASARAELADTVATARDLDEEWRELVSF